MLDLLFYLKCSGPNVREDNLRDTITSFIQKNKNTKFSMFFSIEENFSSILNNILKENNISNDMVLEIKISNDSWALDFNYFFLKYKHLANWLIISHDDVLYLTDNYFENILNQVNYIDPEKIGWITSSNNYYLINEGRIVTDTFRAGFYNDSNSWPVMWQLHNIKHLQGATPDVIRNSIHLLDMPPKPVKIHGIMSAVMIISMKSLEKIGLCEDWTRYTMLIDADWSLESLKNNLINVWVPNVEHVHPIRRNLRPTNNKWVEEAHMAFYKKWKFYKNAHCPNGIAVTIDGLPKSNGILNIDELRAEYGKTNIPWSSYRNSFDWEFIDE